MLKKFSQKINLCVLIFLAMALALPSYPMQVLYAGVKINSKAITEDKFLLTRAELDDFLKAKEDLKAANVAVIEKTAQVAACQQVISDLNKSFNAMLDRVFTLSDKSIESSKEKDEVIKAMARAQKSKNNTNLIGAILTGLAFGVKF